MSHPTEDGPPPPPEAHPHPIEPQSQPGESPRHIRHPLRLLLCLICVSLLSPAQAQDTGPKPDVLTETEQQAMEELKRLGMEVSVSDRLVKFQKDSSTRASRQTLGSSADPSHPDFWPRLQAALRAFGCKKLYFSSWHSPKELPGLDELTRLEVLNFTFCTGLQSLPDLSNLDQLRELNLSFCTDFQGTGVLKGLAGLRGLKTLDLEGCHGLTDTAPMARLTQLENLDLSHCTALKDSESFQGISGLRGLKRLHLYNCTGLDSTAPLAGLDQLELLDLSDCTGLQGNAAWQELTKLQALRILDLVGCTGLDAEAVREVWRRVPAECRIIGPDGEDVKP